VELRNTCTIGDSSGFYNGLEEAYKREINFKEKRHGKVIIVVITFFRHKISQPRVIRIMIHNAACFVGRKEFATVRIELTQINYKIRETQKRRYTSMRQRGTVCEQLQSTATLSQIMQLSSRSWILALKYDSV